MENYGGSGIMRLLRDHPPTHYTFEVNCVSMMVKMKQDKYESGVFEAAGYKWKLIFYPNGNKEANVRDHISLYLAIEDTDSLPETWEVSIDFKLFVFDQTKKKFLSIQDVADPIKRFHDGKREWGIPKLLELEAFKDPTNGYLVNDRGIFGAEVFTAQAIKKSECLSITTGDGQNYGFVSQMDSQYVLDGRDTRTCVPRNGSNLQNGLFRTFRNLAPTQCLFKTESFSSLCNNVDDVYESDIFESGGFKWSLILHPKGNQKRNVKESLSLYLRIVETNELSRNWEVFATFTFFIYDDIKDQFLTVQDGSVKRFHEMKKEWGFDNLISIKDFEDASNGFLGDDQCSFGAELMVIKHEGKIVETVPPKIVEKLSIVNLQIAKESETTTFRWKIEDISKEAGKTIHSPPFVMGGFKWNLRVYPTGYGDAANNSMSLYLNIHEEDWKICIDEKLSKSFEVQAEYKICISDQLMSSPFERKSDKRSFDSGNKGWGNLKFISLEKLHDESLGYKKDDAVIIEVTFISFSISWDPTKN